MIEVLGGTALEQESRQDFEGAWVQRSSSP